MMAMICGVSMATSRPLLRPVSSVLFSTSNSRAERFGSSDGSSGWKWEKNGIGMGGKDKGPATEAKDSVGKNKNYKVPEYFTYNSYSFYDFEKAMLKNRVPQPKSGLSEFW